MKRAKDSTVAIFAGLGAGQGRALGSGVALRRNVVLTCRHVVVGLPPGASLLVARDADWDPAGSPTKLPLHRATLRMADEARDLALVDVSDLDASPVTLGGMLEDGDEAFFIGHPTWQNVAVSPPSVGVAVISAHEMIDNRRHVYRLDASVNHGDSGGGLFSRSTGALVGLIDAKAGSLSLALQTARDTPPTASISIGGADPVALVRQTLHEMDENLQLGIGFAIDGQEIGAFLASAGPH